MFTLLILLGIFIDSEPIQKEAISHRIATELENTIIIYDYDGNQKVTIKSESLITKDLSVMDYLVYKNSSPGFTYLGDEYRFIAQ